MHDEAFHASLRLYPDSSLPAHLQRRRYRQRVQRTRQHVATARPHFLSVSLASNDIADAGAAAVLAAVAKSPALQSVSLRDNCVTYATGARALDVMVAHGRLRALDLRGNAPHLGRLRVRSRAAPVLQHMHAGGLVREL